MVTTRTLSKLAANGDSDAQFRLGYRFAFCKDRRRRNLKRAFSLWKAAAEQGHVRARFYLGTCYDFGSGIRRNARRSMFWYRQAAMANHDVAQYNLALGFRDGLGVPRSQRIAVKWLRVSAAAGNADAQNDLGYCLHEGLGVGKDRRQAFRWYLRAAREGVVRAQFNVGLCYRDGDGITASKLKAREWLQKAARRRHARAREILRGGLQSTESLDRRKERRSSATDGSEPFFRSNAKIEPCRRTSCLPRPCASLALTALVSRRNCFPVWRSRTRKSPRHGRPSWNGVPERSLKVTLRRLAGRLRGPRS